MSKLQRGSWLSCVMTLALLWSITLTAGCGGSDVSDDITKMVYPDNEFVLLYDVSAISAGEAYHKFAEEVASEWTQTVGAIGILMDETEEMLLGVTGTGDSYMVMTGKFDFDLIRGELDDNNYERRSFSGHEVWSGGRLWYAATVALMEESEMVLRGEDSVVKHILGSLSRDSGPDDMSPLMRAVEVAGDGWLISGIDQCLNALTGCKRLASSFSAGRQHELSIRHVFMFQNEQAAEMAKNHLQRLIDEGGEEMDEIHDLEADREFVTLSGSIDEDDFYRSYSLSGRGPYEDPPGW